MNLKEAKNLSKDLCGDAKRLSGETYYEHALEIVTKLSSYGIKDETTLIVAILHHCLDFSDEISKKKLLKRIPEDLMELIKKYNEIAKKTIQVESFEKYNEKYAVQAFISLGGDIRLLIVRIVDKLQALENSWVLDREKQKEAALRAFYLYTPLAKILGVYKVSRDIENAAFKILYPESYFGLEQVVKKKSWGTKKIFREVEKFLREVLSERGLSNFEIQYRTKGLYSLFKKINRYTEEGMDIGENLERIYDLFALRIIVETVEECYLVENLLTQLWNNLPEERNDYIEYPRQSGYQSIQNAFKIDGGFTVEIQIRTHEMHKQAEFGSSSHLLYKIGDKGIKSGAAKKFKQYLSKNPSWFKELNYWEVEKEQKYIPNTPFKNKIYVFTPKGDIIELPKGASTVDFAYAVHTEIGNKCVGAFVNGQIVKLDQKLKTGDTIKIKVGKKKRGPNKDWVNFVKTRQAKIQINKAGK